MKALEVPIQHQLGSRGKYPVGALNVGKGCQFINPCAVDKTVKLELAIIEEIKNERAIT